MVGDMRAEEELHFPTELKALPHPWEIYENIVRGIAMDIATVKTKIFNTTDAQEGVKNIEKDYLLGNPYPFILMGFAVTCAAENRQTFLAMYHGIFWHIKIRETDLGIWPSSHFGNNRHPVNAVSAIANDGAAIVYDSYYQNTGSARWLERPILLGPEDSVDVRFFEQPGWSPKTPTEIINDDTTGLIDLTFRAVGLRFPSDELEVARDVINARLGAVCDF
jgi:hypothetical protein